MTAENLWIIDGNESGEIREDQNKVSEQDRKKIQDDWAKAKKVQQQIQVSKQENNKIANFLAFLLKDIQNEKIMDWIYHTFFKTQNPEDKQIYLRKTANSLVLIGFFVPFYQKKIKEAQLNRYFENLWIYENMDFWAYLEFLTSLSEKYHDNVPIIQDALVDLIYQIVSYYKITKPWLKEEEIKPLIIRKLY